ncbi:MAG: hypothetical protein FJX76_00265 [Armatimonadetes bacterium]|nr:hypothetical protein [Armatimonadota bacterium]
MRRRGFTLVEILVAGGLLLLLLGVVWYLLVPAWRAYMKGDRKSDVQRNSMVVGARIAQEFRNAYGSSVAVKKIPVTTPDGEVRQDAVIFLSDLDLRGDLQLTPDGDPIWQKRVVFYHDGETNQIRSKEIPLDPPSVDPDPLIVETFDRSPKDRIIARHVKELKFSWDLAPSLQIIVQAEREGYTSRFETSVTPLLDAFVPPPPPPSSSPSP